MPIAGTALGVRAAPVFPAPLLGVGALRLMPVFRLGDRRDAVATGRAVDVADVAPLVTGPMFLPVCPSFAGRSLTKEQLP